MIAQHIDIKASVNCYIHICHAKLPHNLGSLHRACSPRESTQTCSMVGFKKLHFLSFFLIPEPMLSMRSKSLMPSKLQCNLKLNPSQYQAVHEVHSAAYTALWAPGSQTISCTTCSNYVHSLFFFMQCHHRMNPSQCQAVHEVQGAAFTALVGSRGTKDKQLHRLHCDRQPATPSWLNWACANTCF